MLTPDGGLGGIAVVAESTYGTTPGTPTWLWLNHITSSLGPRRSIVQPQWATYAPPSNREYSVAWADGEISCALSYAAGMLALFGAGSTASGAVYTFGSGDEPDTNSLSVLQNYGGGDASTAANYFEWIFAGFKPTAYRFEFQLDGNATLTVPGIAQSTTKSDAGDAETPSPPAESSIIMPSDVGSVTYGGSSTAIAIQSATITVNLPKTGSERRGLGQSTIREPVTNAQPTIDFSISLDLDASSGNDTIALLDDFVDGTEMGALTIGDFALSNCMVQGDPPSLSLGLMQYSLNGQATSLAVTTS